MRAPASERSNRLRASWRRRRKPCRNPPIPDGFAGFVDTGEEFLFVSVGRETRVVGFTSHSTFNFFRPCMAAQVESASTATPPSCWNRWGCLNGGKRTVFCTPFTFKAVGIVEGLHLRVIDRRALHAAYNIPGLLASIPKIALPVTISCWSRSATFLPM